MDLLRQFCARFKYPQYIEFEHNGRIVYSPQCCFLAAVDLFSFTFVAAVVMQVLVILCFLALPLEIGLIVFAFVIAFTNDLVRMRGRAYFLVIYFIILAFKHDLFAQWPTFECNLESAKRFFPDMFAH